MKTYLCIAETVRQGDIVAAERPLGRGWVSFDPGELSGDAELMPVPPEVRPKERELLFHYRIAETGERFFLSWIQGTDQVTLIPVEGSGRQNVVHQRQDVVQKDQGKTVYSRPDPDLWPPLTARQNVGASAFRGFVRWRPGGAKPEPSRQEPQDPLRKDDGIDWLRRGL